MTNIIKAFLAVSNKLDKFDPNWGSLSPADLARVLDQVASEIDIASEEYGSPIKQRAEIVALGKKLNSVTCERNRLKREKREVGGEMWKGKHKIEKLLREREILEQRCCDLADMNDEFERNKNALVDLANKRLDEITRLKQSNSKLYAQGARVHRQTCKKYYMRVRKLEKELDRVNATLKETESSRSLQQCRINTLESMVQARDKDIAELWATNGKLRKDPRRFDTWALEQRIERQRVAIRILQDNETSLERKVKEADEFVRLKKDQLVERYHQIKDLEKRNETQADTIRKYGARIDELVELPDVYVGGSWSKLDLIVPVIEDITEVPDVYVGRAWSELEVEEFVGNDMTEVPEKPARKRSADQQRADAMFDEVKGGSD